MKKSADAIALEHALRALEDGSGHDVWGPRPVGAVLWTDGRINAAKAFDDACSVAMRLGHIDRARSIATMKRLAPVILEAIEASADGA